jgi:phosphopantothenoylcysteine decarboxylase/phosphopantothenate--cysteine ligase
MGYALAQASAQMGADTTLISGPVNLKPPNGVKLISIESNAQLLSAVKREIKKTDCLIMAAAPADFTPDSRANAKIKRSDAVLNLKLKSTKDILKEIAPLKKKHQRVVGFALETNDGVANARKKLKEKKLDLIVLNTPSDTTGFDHDTNEVLLIAPGKKPVKLDLASKLEISFGILDRVASLL